ncbi:MAG: hypothetical protein WC525_00045 [Candidatus Thermoplasmatota archaeon]
MKRKCLAIGIILLFVGVTIAPAINFNTAKASTDDDLVEVTTQPCGIKGYGDTTVKLTREQYQNLEQYLVEFRARLNQTSTREEAVPLFKDAVVELDKYGLLPRGMSVERAQRLVVGNGKSTNIVNKIHNSEISVCHNFFCLITGEAEDCRVAKTVISAFRIIFEKFFTSRIEFFLLYMGTFFLWIMKNFTPASMLNFLSLLTFGDEFYNYPGYGAYPSTGWIYTVGVNGIDTINGSLWGHIEFPVMAFYWKCYTGAFGFTGIKLGSFFLGAAVLVKVDVFQPPW